MSTQTSQTIPAIMIGVHRFTAIDTASVFDNTLYTIAAVLDLTETPTNHQYNPQNLGAVLYALHPRPRVLITGTAVASLVPEAKRVWEEYVENTLEADGGDQRAAFVALSDFHSADGPPPPGTVEYLIKQLNTAFS